MKSKKLVINIMDPDSISEAIKYLESYNKQVENKVDLFLKRLAEKGVEIAKTKIIDYPAVFTSELLNSFRAEARPDKSYAIVTDCQHAAFVEFGTGPKGKASPYQYKFPDGVTWQYSDGPPLIQIKNGEYGWFFPMPDGTWRFTQGMPSRPFMQETALELEKIIPKVAKEVFNAR